MQMKLFFLVIFIAMASFARATDPYQPIPAGFDFPADQKALEALRDNLDVKGMRAHVWSIWAGLTQSAPSGGPIWETWYREDEVFHRGPSLQAAERKVERRFSRPRQFRTLRAAPEAAGQSLLAQVLYNQEAFQHVRNNRYYLPDTFVALNRSFDQKNTPADQRKILDFENSAVSLKVVWQIIPNKGLSALAVWDTRQLDPTKAYPPRTWSRFVAVDPSRDMIPDGEIADANFQGQLKKNCAVVSISRFYHFAITPALAQQINALGQAHVSEGDIALLVGMHVTTKEIPEWVWATFWWHDKPDTGLYSEGRPATVQGVWRNYLMQPAYSADVPKEQDQSQHICFNPWLEAPFSSGVVSNCIACHQRASLPENLVVPDFLPVQRRRMRIDDPFFAKTAQTDFLWSIPDLASQP